MRPVICSTGSQNSRTVVYWNIRVSQAELVGCFLADPRVLTLAC